MTKQGLTALKYPKSLFLCAFGMEGLISENAQGCSPGTLLYFEEANPKLQETAKKEASYDKTRFDSIEIS